MIVFDINNAKEAYADAFRMIHQKEVDKGDFVIATVMDIYTNTLSDYQALITEYETNPERHRSFSGTLHAEDIFYFRVTSRPVDHLVNYHYFFLGSRYNDRDEDYEEKYCLGIIESPTSGFAEREVISGFLLYESLSSNKTQGFTINPPSKKKRKYSLELISLESETVFFLRPQGQCQTYPHKLNRNRPTISRKIFPQMLITEDNISHFEQNAESLYSFAEVRRKKQTSLFENNVFYSIASRSLEIDLKDSSKVAENSNGRVFDLPLVDLTVDVLSDFCRKQIDAICRIPQELLPEQKTSSAQRKYLKKKIDASNTFLEKNAKITSALAFCLFLMFWRFIVEEQSKEFLDAVGFLLDNVRDDLLIDAQDYADGILQLLENAKNHSEHKEGFLCLRIHHTGRDENAVNDSREYLKMRYGDAYVDESVNKKFYLEVLISDYNTRADIVQTFHTTSREKTRHMSDESLDVFKKLQLEDFFNYNRDEAVKNAWEEFFKKPENLISHYGLLVFEHLVDFADGTFRLFSSCKRHVGLNQVYSNDEESSMSLFQGNFAHIPGTQYEILLPIELKYGSRSTGLNAQLQNTDLLHNLTIQTIGSECYRALELVTKRKEEIIVKVFEAIYAELEKFDSDDKVNRIACLDVSKITTPKATEQLTKSIILLLGYHQDRMPKYFAFTHVTDGFLATFIRIFSLIYMKTGQNHLMQGRQLYLCSENAEKEIVFYGNFLQDSVEATYELAVLYKGQPLHETKILLREAEKAKEAKPETTVKVLPFDCAIPRLYQAKIKADLERDITKGPFGCCLKGTHMRVGTKIHTYGNYYEASLLFGVSSYVSRFAYFLCKSSILTLKSVTPQKGPRSCVVVGYETYSENLVIMFKEYLEQSFPETQKFNIDYVIYNDNVKNRKDVFHRWEKVNPNKNTKFIVIVPIGSTLTTHDKIVSDLWRKMKDVYSERDEFLKSIILHHCVVLIRDSREPKASNGCTEKEKRFWTKISNCDEESYVLYRKKSDLAKKYIGAEISADNRIRFFVSVETQWNPPDDCPHCFPDAKKPTNEKPLVQANRASVVPMIMYGSKQESENIPVDTAEEKAEKEEANTNRLAYLKPGLCYGHIVQDKDNHFEYYFKAGKVMDHILSEAYEDFNQWLQKLKAKITPSQNENSDKESEEIHDFIVAPVHSANANFIHKVNKHIKAKQIIWLDIKREYRSNIKAKYSNLRILYDNLHANRQELAQDVNIRFHFVDNSISTGDSFYRAKSLLQSLFPPDVLSSYNEVPKQGETLKNERKVRVSIFENVIILINRCSKNTQMDYAKEGHFHSFISLNISPMRNHSDACVPCKRRERLLSDVEAVVSTNEISRLSLRKAEGLQEEDVKNIIGPEDLVSRKWKETLASIDNKDRYISYLLDRGYYRMLATHQLNQNISLPNNKEDSERVKELIWGELSTICEAFNEKPIRETTDKLFSLLKVISRPFLSFRKSVLEAALPIIIELCEYSLRPKKDTLKATSDVRDFVDFLRKETEDEWGENPFNKLLHILFSSLANMNSTYLLRITTIEAVAKHCKSLPEEKSVDMINTYMFSAKQVLCLGGKSTLSVWIEDQLKHSSFARNGTMADRLKNYLFLENITPIYDALKECKNASSEKFTREKLSSGKDVLDDLGRHAKEILQQYFCEPYRLLVGIKNKDLRVHCKETFAPMLYLSFWLEQHDIRSDRDDAFYEIVLKNTAEILGVEELPHTKDGSRNIGLFIRIKEGEKNNQDAKTNLPIYQLAPARGLEYLDFLKEKLKGALTGSKPYCELGETFYYEKGSNFAYLKLHNFAHKSETELRIDFYFVFTFKENLDFLTRLTNVRNLLSMRRDLVERLSADYQNNSIATHLSVLESLQALSSEKAGSHAPYEELRRGFYTAKKSFEATEMLGMHTATAELVYDLYSQFKIIADSLVSKWYLHEVNTSFPKGLDPKEKNASGEYPRIYSLCQFERILKSVVGARIKEDGLFIHSDETSEINLDFSETFDSLRNWEYIWVCAFFELYFNALRHGAYTKEDNRCRYVKVRVIMDNEKILFENEMRDKDKTINQKSITLTGLKYYFDHYYGPNTFTHSGKDDRKDGVFRAWLPLRANIKKKKEKEDVQTNE